MENVESTLTLHGVRPTAVRILIYRVLQQFNDTFSMTDVETAADTLDKSTIFRTLTLFAEHHLLHEIEDGSGSKKYCLCHNDHECSVEELHCHFYCESCKKTFCLDEAHIPPVNTPPGFIARQAEYIIKGTCADCAKSE